MPRTTENIARRRSQPPHIAAPCQRRHIFRELRNEIRENFATLYLKAPMPLESIAKNPIR